MSNSNKELILPDYNNCITNLACSIQKYFGMKPLHNSLEQVDEFLKQKGPKNVVVILCDGMGTNLLKKKLNEEDFLRKHLVGQLTSVAPSTTTAATTSMMCGLNPVEHGWLGWDLYVKPIGKIVTLFRNKLKNTLEDAADYDVARRYYPYKSIFEKINKKGEFSARSFFPFGENPYTDLNDLNSMIEEECLKEGKKYIYAYNSNPDYLMHDFGTNSREVNENFYLINNKIEELAEKLKDSVIIVTADHGHLDCNDILLTNYSDFFDTLRGDTWIEGRCCSFNVKQKKRKKFEKLFEKYFGKDFILKTKEEIISEKLFGDGKENVLFRDSLGDYLALAVGDKYFRYDESSIVFKSVHAGFTKDEMAIPLIMISK